MQRRPSGAHHSQTLCLVAEGGMVLYFAQTTTLTSAIVAMVFFSLFVQAAEGSTYGIVPYVDPPTTGAIAGIVGAGGNTGAVCFSFCFHQLAYKNAFVIMGYTTLGAAFFSVFVLIKGHAGMFCGKDLRTQQTVSEEIFTPYNIQQRKRGLTSSPDDSSSSSSDSACSDDELDDLNSGETVASTNSSVGIGLGVGNLGTISPILEEVDEEA